MKVFIKNLLFLIPLIIISLWQDKIFAATANVTPEIYEITIKKIEFRNQATGSFVTVKEGDLTFNIASVTAGQTVGSYVSGSAIPEGTYDQVRVTISRNMGIKATGAVGGTTYYTTSTSADIPSEAGIGSGTNVTISTNSALYAQGTLQVPSGVSGVDASAGTFTETDTLSTPIVVKKGLTKSMKVKFDVTNTVTFNTDPTPDIAYPNAPGVSEE